MNYKPLLKIIGVLGFGWLLFFIAKTAFIAAPNDHLDLIPADVDALVIINNRKVGEELFYQRVFNEEVYKKYVTIDDELERELIQDALNAEINLLSPIAVFSYGSKNIPILGITCHASSENGLDLFIDHYLKKLELHYNYELRIEKGKALVLLSPDLSPMELQNELDQIMNGDYGKAIDSDWYQPMLKEDQDLVAYFAPGQSSGSLIDQFFLDITPNVVNASYSFITVNDEQVTIKHQVELNDDAENLFNDNPFTLENSSFPASLSLGINKDVIMASEFQKDDLSLVLLTDSGKIEIRIDSLLEKDIHFGFKSINIDPIEIAQGILPVDFDGMIALGYNKIYWMKLKTQLQKVGKLNEKDGRYQLDLKLAIAPLLKLRLFIDETQDHLIIYDDAFDGNVQLTKTEMEVPLHAYMNSQTTFEGVLIGNQVDYKDLKEFGEVHAEIIEMKGNQAVIEITISNKEQNHSLIDMLHIFSNHKKFIEGIKSIIDLTTVLPI